MGYTFSPRLHVTPKWGDLAYLESSPGVIQFQPPPVFGDGGTAVFCRGGTLLFIFHEFFVAEVFP